MRLSHFRVPVVVAWLALLAAPTAPSTFAATQDRVFVKSNKPDTRTLVALVIEKHSRDGIDTLVFLHSRDETEEIAYSRLSQLEDILDKNLCSQLRFSFRDKCFSELRNIQVEVRHKAQQVHKQRKCLGVIVGNNASKFIINIFPIERSFYHCSVTHRRVLAPRERVFDTHQSFATVDHLHSHYHQQSLASTETAGQGLGNDYALPQVIFLDSQQHHEPILHQFLFGDLETGRKRKH